MIKGIIIALLLSTSPVTIPDIANIEHVTVYQAGISIEYNEDYCINNGLDYRGYWIDFSNSSAIKE